ncbi:hypothetical protein SDC9_171427 [bioreactor metagenome]|uniref:Uncharacterized protein n=1 Tax=bioreactor metagenome TaxID=1076179 RepID=A0A645GJE8_9ZZZZ
MNSLNDQDIIRSHDARPFLEHSGSCFEVVERLFNRFPIDELCQVFVKQRQIDGRNAFKIKISFLIHGGCIAIDKVIVHGNRQRL